MRRRRKRRKREGKEGETSLLGETRSEGVRTPQVENVEKGIKKYSSGGKGKGDGGRVEG